MPPRHRHDTGATVVVDVLLPAPGDRPQPHPASPDTGAQMRDHHAMTRTEDYRAALASGRDPEALTLAESGLPGPRGNLELIAALAAFADEPTLRRWAALSPQEAPGDQPLVVLAAGGIVGLGRFVAGRADLLAELHEHARDPRWRIREAVAMAFQDAGRADPGALVDLLQPWLSDPEPLVQRAVMAALCEPALLRDVAVAVRVIDALEAITTSLVGRPDRRAPDVRVLRQALGYGWSVAIVAAPDAGKQAFERWLTSADPDIRWIVRENLRKARLTALDRDWVAACTKRAGLS